VEEAQDLYKRVRKLRRSVAALQPLLDQLQLKIRYVEEVESSLLQLSGQGPSLASELQALREVAEEVSLDDKGGKTSTFFSTIMNRLVDPGGSMLQPVEQSIKAVKQSSKKQHPQRKGHKGKASEPGGGKAQPAKVMVSSYRRSPDSPPVVIGRNSRQNDYITFSLAKPHEVWLHARGVPGAHCLLRIEPGGEVTDEDLQFAADLAAYFSKARTSTEVPIMYTSPKHLKKIAGGGPGMVNVMKEKVIWGRPEEGKKVLSKQPPTN